MTGEAELHAFEGGVLSWMESRLDALGARRPAKSSVLLLTHHPFRCRFPVPDWYFCFSTADKARLREAIDRRGLRHAFWGQLAGHQHRWYDGEAFDEPAWRGFRQWENSAVKGDQADHAMQRQAASASLR